MSALRAPVTRPSALLTPRCANPHSREQLAKFGTSSPSTRSNQQVRCVRAVTAPAPAVHGARCCLARHCLGAAPRLPACSRGLHPARHQPAAFPFAPLVIVATPGSAALSLMENVSSKRDNTGKIDRAKFRGLEGGKVELPPNASTALDLNPSPDARTRGGLKHKAVVPGSSSPVRRIALAGWLAGLLDWLGTGYQYC